MPLIPRMKKIHSKMKLPQDFSNNKSIGIFLDAQGQLTPQYLIQSSRISNSVKTLWLCLYPAKMKKIQSKMKALEWPQDFPHYNPMEAICYNGNQSSDQIWPKT